ncbi:MAG: ABC transporter permease [Bacteroidota bacterium]
MDTQRYLANATVAFEAIMANKLRSMLTALGIIFGVAAVIAMLAIGNGAQKEILEQIKLVGVNNIVITPVVEQEEGEAKKDDNEKEAGEKKKFSPGLMLNDAKAIAEVVPNISLLSSEIMLDVGMVSGGKRRSGKLVGIEKPYFEIYNYTMQSGRNFNSRNNDYGEQVCVIGSGVKAKFFSSEDPIGKYLKCGQHWLRVVGVLAPRPVSEGSVSKLGIRDFNMDVYTPLKTILLRYSNRSLVTQAMINAAQAWDSEENADKTKKKNYHQIDRLVVQMKESKDMSPSAEVISRLLERRHLGVVDYEISIPEQLLRQQQRTKDIFNVVLGAIAGISLLVGGIGIMNIMLASVLERIKEIGLRISLGAKKRDIVFQFLVEATCISLSGGIIGVILGVAIALIIAKVAAIPTIISGLSIVISFGVAALIGLVFGIAPARRAANQDPITSLRYE